MTNDPRHDWWRQALCAQRTDINFLSQAPDDVRSCRDICLQCRVRIDCLADALRDPCACGVRAGHTPVSLARLRRAARLARLADGQARTEARPAGA